MADDIFEFEKENEKLTKRQKKLLERQLNDMRILLKKPEFRRFLWDILSICGLYRNPFNPNSSMTAFNSGEQNIGQQILRKINAADMYAFAQIQNEYLSEQRNREIEREKENQENKE